MTVFNECANDGCNNSTRGKYCSRSCSSSMNNRLHPKRSNPELIRSSCKHCGKQFKPRVSKGTSRIPCCRDSFIELFEARSFRPTKKQLYKFGIKKEECEWCHTSEWRGQRLPLELDHIDGNSSNNKLSNLRLLCPNCHSITPTWRKPKRLLKDQ